MVVEDVKNGFVSLEAAKKQYGVVIDIKTWKAHRLPKTSYEKGEKKN
jgi:N-methylhydantoinase B/oxoprolinase/acetone carboxylase alpha subunit